MKHPKLIQDILDSLIEDIDRIGLVRGVNQIRKKYKVERLENLKAIIEANKQAMIVTLENARLLSIKIVTLEQMVRDKEKNNDSNRKRDI